MSFIIPITFIVLFACVVGGTPIWISYGVCIFNALSDEKMHKKEIPVIFW